MYIVESVGIEGAKNIRLVTMNDGIFAITGINVIAPTAKNIILVDTQTQIQLLVTPTQLKEMCKDDKILGIYGNKDTSYTDILVIKYTEYKIGCMLEYVRGSCIDLDTPFLPTDFPITDISNNGACVHIRNDKGAQFVVSFILDLISMGKSVFEKILILRDEELCLVGVLDRNTESNLVWQYRITDKNAFYKCIAMYKLGEGRGY